MSSFRSFFIFCLALALGAAPATAQEKPLRVVASFTILADMVQTVGGSDVEGTSLVGPNGDAHTYQPTPTDVKKVAQADIIIINGLHLEGWLSRLIDASGSKAKLLVASAGVRPRLMEEDGEQVVDPHAWQDLSNGKIYVGNITAALIAARPERKDVFTNRAETYIRQLVTLDKATKETIAALPKNTRKIITDHDAFGYFAQAYGVKLMSPVGLSTEAEPSASTLSALIKQIKTEKIQTIFLENMASPRLMEQIAQETGAKVGGTLYADALSEPSGDAPTYLAMFKHNVKLMIDSMKAQPN